MDEQVAKSRVTLEGFGVTVAKGKRSLRGFQEVRIAGAAVVCRIETRCEIGSHPDAPTRGVGIQAAIPEDEFTAYVSEFTDEKKELTSAAVMRKWSASQSPDNSKVAPEPVGLVASLNSLNSAMKRIYDSWPSEDIGVLSAKLRGFAEEIDETGRLEL